jgi:hypothetical protein
LFQQPEFIEENSKQVRKRIHNNQKLSSGSTEEATYYAIDGADENGRYILIPEIFGTNDLNVRKAVRRNNGLKTEKQFHTMEAFDELYLRKCSTKHAPIGRDALTCFAKLVLVTIRYFFIKTNCRGAKWFTL